MKRKPFYCMLCHQEFNHPKEHDAGSFFKGERLNGHCKGDIRHRAPIMRQPRPNTDPPARLEFNGEPIEIR